MNIKVMFQHRSDFRNFRYYCDCENIQYHTYRDSTIKMLSVIIDDISVSLHIIFLFCQFVSKILERLFYLRMETSQDKQSVFRLTTRF